MTVSYLIRMWLKGERARFFNYFLALTNHLELVDCNTAWCYIGTLAFKNDFNTYLLNYFV